MEFFGKLWRGERGLAFTYWVMGVGVSIPFMLWDTVAAKTAIGGYEITNSDVQMYFLFSSPAYAYTIFILISVWRSANRYKAEKDTGGGWGTALRDRCL